MKDLAAITKEAYCRPSGRPQVAAVAKRYGVRRSSIHAEARRQGLSNPTGRQRPWDDPREIEILKKWVHLSDQVIQKKLAAGGFKRTKSAIAIYRKRHIGLRDDLRLEAGYIAAPKLAEFLGVCSKTVNYWIRKKWLRAQNVPGSGREVGICLVRESDIREFLIHYTGHVDFSRVDKYWLIDILCPTHGQKTGGSKDE